MALGFWAGVRQAQVARQDRKDARERFLAESLEKTKSIVIPELLNRIENKKKGISTRKERVALAQNFGFSRKAALALEKTDQLEFELNKLQKIGLDKVSQGWVNELTSLVEDLLDPKDPNYDETLANAVAAGLDIGNIKDDDERLEGLLKAINATDEKGLNEALIDLLPTTETETKPSKIDYNTKKGRGVSRTEIAGIRSELAKRIGPMLGATYTDVPDPNNPGLKISQLTDPEINKILLDVTDTVVEQYIKPRIYTEESDLIDFAGDVVQDYADYLRTQGTDEIRDRVKPDHFEDNFDELFLKYLQNENNMFDGVKYWEQKLQPPKPVEPVQTIEQAIPIVTDTVEQKLTDYKPNQPEILQ
jgi:hypothetical protein